jgi:acetyltransferase-like isoleucine patch superfamily enzyme
MRISPMLLSLAIDMPWVAFNEIRRILVIPWLRFLFFLHGVHWGKGWAIYGMPVIQRFRGSAIVIGDRATLRSWKTANPVALNQSVVLATRSRQAVIQIGNDVGITCSNLVAAGRIEIGSRVLIGANCLIVDTDFHPIDPALRQKDLNAGKTDPVRIGNDVFIGMNSIILKGTVIGDGAVIGAGSVVSGEIPAHAVAYGNPASVHTKP